MGLKDRLKEFTERELSFELPDGSTIGLRPVNALTVIPRMGLPPSVLRKFFNASGASELEEQQAIQAATEDPDLIYAGQRWEEAYWVEGIASVDGEPVRLIFSDEEGDGIPVSVFKAFITRTYGPETTQKLDEAIKRVSGYVLPEEVQADAEAFQDVAGDAALSGEDLRH